MFYDEWLHLEKKASQLSTKTENCNVIGSQVMDKIFNASNSSIDRLQKTIGPDDLHSKYRIFGGCGIVISLRI